MKVHELRERERMFNPDGVWRAASKLKASLTWQSYETALFSLLHLSGDFSVS